MNFTQQMLPELIESFTTQERQPQVMRCSQLSHQLEEQSLIR
jgi:hypothetical protein